MCFAKFLEENWSGSLSQPCCFNPLRLLNTVCIRSTFLPHFFVHTPPLTPSPHVQVTSFFQDPPQMPSFQKAPPIFSYTKQSFSTLSFYCLTQIQPPYCFQGSLQIQTYYTIHLFSRVPHPAPAQTFRKQNQL